MPHLERPDGTRLHYEVDGQGPPLLLIAGFMSDGASWGPIVPLLSPHYTLVRPDNRSTGQTIPWNAPCGPAIWAEDALALMSHLGHARYGVFGHSLGGLIGWIMAYMAPERVASLLMAGSAVRHFERNTALFRSLIDVRRAPMPPETWLRLLYPWLFHMRLFDDPSRVTAMISLALTYPHGQSVDAMEHQLNALYDNVDPTPFMTAPGVPTRALLGDADLLVPYTEAKASLEGLDTVLIPECGHSLHWDQPARIAEEALRFAKEHA